MAKVLNTNTRQADLFHDTVSRSLPFLRLSVSRGGDADPISCLERENVKRRWKFGNSSFYGKGES